MYLEIRGSDLDAIADALEDIRYSIVDGHLFGDGEYYGTTVSWKLNVNQV
jgi:hypothetical protein